jgi:hypothetical protein
MSMNRAERRRAERLLTKKTPELWRLGADIYDALPVHVRDQQAAAIKETSQTVEAIGSATGLRLVHPEPGEAEGAYAALLLAMASRIKDFCPHSRGGPVLGKRTVVHLSLGWVACESCVATFLARPAFDDGRCDICDMPAPHGMFTEHVTQGGSVLWILNLGECCEDKFPGGIEP